MQRKERQGYTMAGSGTGGGILRRDVLLLAMTAAFDARADASAPMLAAYYDRHAALVDGVAWGWTGQGRPQRLRADVRAVAVSREHWLLLLDDGTLQQLSAPAGAPATLARGLRSLAAGESGWFGIDTAGVLWQGAPGRESRRVADRVAAACIGDGADYYVDADGGLWVRGLAHRGQYGDGRLTESRDFVRTAGDAVAVRGHTGHAIHLRRDGTVMGTGGNRYGPLSSHGLGDKADRWGPVFDGASAIATGSRHSAAIRADGSLWVWGEGFAIAPARLMERVRAVACGDTVTIALDAQGALWQWDRGAGPRRLAEVR
jgi:hypothetical protein